MNKEIRELKKIDSQLEIQCNEYRELAKTHSDNDTLYNIYSELRNQVSENRSNIYKEICKLERAVLSH